MGLLSGAVSISRFNVTRRPPEPDFDAARFEEIEPSSELESRGVIPFAPGADYRVGDNRWAFRVRIDRLRPDATRLRERFRELIQDEIDAGAETIAPKLRRELRQTAKEEVLATAAVSTRILECCLDDDVLYVVATAKAPLVVVAGELERIGIEIAAKAPWVRRGEEVESGVDLVALPAQSAVGFEMMRELLGDTVLDIEPDRGRVKLQSRDTQITLAGMVIHDLLHFLEQEADILAARMVTEDATFDFDVVNFRVTNLRIATEPTEDWKEQLNGRLERIAEIFEILDMKYYELSHQE